VVELLTKSAEIYKNLNLTEEKNNIEHCINTISASLKNILADSLSMKTQASPKKTVESISQKNLRKYQPTSERLATIFFKNLYSDNIQNTNFETTEKLPLCISKLAQTNKIR
jgi:copper chaperone CopZ